MSATVSLSPKTFCFPPLAIAERAVLTSLLRPTSAVIDAVGDLPAEAFVNPAHQYLFWSLLVGDVRFDDGSGDDYLQQLVASASSVETPAPVVVEACDLIRRNWLERLEIETNVIDLATCAPRGAA